MKKILLYSILALLTVGCTQQGRWNRQQKREIRQTLRDYRDMVYLEDMTDAEFIIFTDDVAEILEGTYPNYVTFMAMPMVDDTVESVVVTTIVSDIQANHRNMRHIFPYRDLVEDGVLPAKMSRDAILQFYNCLADDVNSYYGSLNSFVYAAINSALDDAVIANFQQQCASQFINGVETITITETDSLTYN